MGDRNLDHVRRRASCPSGARRVAVIGVVGAGLLLTGCANDNQQNSLEPQGDSARKILDLFTPFFWIGVVIGVAVIFGVVYAALRFRARSDDERPRQVHGNTGLEVGWTILPALILVVMAVPTVALVFDLAEEPRDAVDITVTGKQWWWEYEYTDEGFFTANEMHIPVDRPVYLTLKSDNVIHSFWVPSLAGKLDVVPGREQHLTISADETGVFLGQCAEYCGLSHANMRLRIFVDTPDDYQAWLDGQKKPLPADKAAVVDSGVISKFGCTGCHSFDPTQDTGIGPNLTHLASRTTFAGAIFDLDEEELRKWVHDAPSRKPAEADKGVGMPSFAASMSEEDLGQVVDFLLSLS